VVADLVSEKYPRWPAALQLALVDHVVKQLATFRPGVAVRVRNRLRANLVDTWWLIYGFWSRWWAGAGAVRGVRRASRCFAQSCPKEWAAVCQGPLRELALMADARGCKDHLNLVVFEPALYVRGELFVPVNFAPSDPHNDVAALHYRVYRPVTPPLLSRIVAFRFVMMVFDVDVELQPVMSVRAWAARFPAARRRTFESILAADPDLAAFAGRWLAQAKGRARLGSGVSYDAMVKANEQVVDKSYRLGEAAPVWPRMLCVPPPELLLYLGPRVLALQEAEKATFGGSREVMINGHGFTVITACGRTLAQVMEAYDNWPHVATYEIEGDASRFDCTHQAPLLQATGASVIKQYRDQPALEGTLAKKVLGIAPTFAISPILSWRDSRERVDVEDVVGFPAHGQMPTGFSITSAWNTRSMIGATVDALSHLPGERRHFFVAALGDDTWTAATGKSRPFLTERSKSEEPEYAGVAPSWTADGMLPLDVYDEYGLEMKLACRAVTADMMDSTFLGQRRTPCVSVKRGWVWAPSFGRVVFKLLSSYMPVGQQQFAQRLGEKVAALLPAARAVPGLYELLAALQERTGVFAPVADESDAHPSRHKAYMGVVHPLYTRADLMVWLNWYSLSEEEFRSFTAYCRHSVRTARVLEHTLIDRVLEREEYA